MEKKKQGVIQVRSSGWNWEASKDMFGNFRTTPTCEEVTQGNESSIVARILATTMVSKNIGIPHDLRSVGGTVARMRTWTTSTEIPHFTVHQFQTDYLLKGWFVP